jgi:bifunctional non-homologous end joining protein LigD
MTPRPEEVEVTHPDKVMFPDDGITKGELVDYYVQVAEVMLPHVRDRPTSLHRFPDGIGGEGFWAKQAPHYFPGWVPRVKVETVEKGTQEQVMASDAATLAYLANQNCVTPHTFLSRADRLDHPDLLVFDLDPPSADDFPAVREGARTLRNLLRARGLEPFVKTTGSKGLHVTVPLDRSASFKEVRRFAEALAAELTERDDRFTMEFRKSARRGRVLVDVARNAYGQTAVPPYAVRARPGAPVAAPIEWSEVDAKLTPVRWTLRNLFRRLAQRDDPWAGIERHAAALPDLD